MAQKTRARTLKAGAKFTDAQGKRHGGGEEVHLTLAQEWHFRDQLVSSGPSDPTAEPGPDDIAANEGRETITAHTQAQPQAPAASPAAPQGNAPAPQAPAGTPAAQAPAAAPQGGQGEPDGAHPIHDLNVAEAAELVASAGTPAALDALEEAEGRHPKHEGGRAGVKRAIESRRAELAG